MKLQELTDFFDEVAPARDALDWDNVGLLVGDPDWDIKKVYVALDATDAVVDAACEAGADLILTHHPLIFKSISRVHTSDFTGRRIIKMIENHIAYFAMHTNFDIHHMGALAEERMGLTHTISLDPCPIDGVMDPDVGIGRIGSLMHEEKSLYDYSELVKKNFELPYVRVYGDQSTMIRTVAISPGSGRGAIDAAVRGGADVLITGDIDHHSGIDAVAKGLCIIDAGHYGVEHIFIRYMSERLEKEFSELSVIPAPMTMPYDIV